MLFIGVWDLRVWDLGFRGSSLVVALPRCAVALSAAAFDVFGLTSYFTPREVNGPVTALPIQHAGGRKPSVQAIVGAKSYVFTGVLISCPRRTPGPLRIQGI